MKRIWIKLFIEILDDMKFGELPEFIKWRAVELFLVAGENGDDGLLPPVKRLAWRIRLPEEKIEETLSALTPIGVVHETPDGWVVTNFIKRQAALTEAERSKVYRDRHKTVTKCDTNSDGSSSDVPSSSTSESVYGSDSLEEGGMGGETIIPITVSEAAKHPDIIIYQAVTGRIPGISQYGTVIDAVRHIRKIKNLTYETEISHLRPYWLAWKSRKRRDGRPYDPGSMTWLTEWAMNECTPPANENPSVEIKSQNEAAIARVAARSRT